MGLFVPLNIGGVTVGLFGLRGGCYVQHADKAIMLQLEMGIAGVRRRIPLVRLDWRPLSDRHKNPRKGPAEHRSRVLFGSHHHTFDLNWLEAEQRMREHNLPFAVPLENEPASFAEMLDLARVLFRINDIDRLPLPEWTLKLI